MRLPEELAEEDVLRFLGATKAPAKVREIAAALGLKHAGRRALGRLLDRLKRHRVVEEVRSGHYRLAGAKSPARAVGAKSNDKSGVDNSGSDFSERLPQAAGRDPNAFVGSLVAHRDGYGFVVPES